jgi:type 1 glutamine amidotransferase
MRISLNRVSPVAIVLMATACGGDTATADQLNAQLEPTVPDTSEQTPTGGGVPTGVNTTPNQGGSSSEGPPEVDGIAPPVTDPDVVTGTGGTDGNPEVPDEPVTPELNAPRSGPFQMLVYSRIGPGAFRHDSIAQGRTMLREIASENDFQVTETETNELITPEGLAQFEIVFFMNSTGDIFNQQEEAAFQDWMETKPGAYAGVHSATDTEAGWAFYKEMTGQYYNGHVNANTAGAIQLEAAMANHPALVGVPNPWQRNEEWYIFNSFQEWSTQEGMMVLGRKQSDNQPIMWAREYNSRAAEFGQWRSFYTAIGHDAAVFRDPVVKQHLTGGIMWAVRREQLLQQ